jgi:hypothetical protein
MRRRPDSGDGGSAAGGWNRVGRGRWGGRGRVHHRICAGGRTEVGIWRGPALRGMKFLGRFSFARAAADAQSIPAKRPVPKKKLHRRGDLERLLEERFSSLVL